MSALSIKILWSFQEDDDYADADYDASKFLTCSQTSDCASLGMICFERICVFESEVGVERVVAETRNEPKPEVASVVSRG